MQEILDKIANFEIPLNEWLLYGIVAFFVVLSLICLLIIYLPHQRMPKMATVAVSANNEKEKTKKLKKNKKDFAPQKKENIELSATAPAEKVAEEPKVENQVLPNVDNQIMQGPDGTNVINLADFAVVYKPELPQTESEEEQNDEERKVVLDGQITVDEQLSEKEEDDLQDEEKTTTITEDGKEYQIVEKKSFEAKLIQSEDETKEFYAQVADYIVSFGVKNKFAWDASMFINKDKKTLAKIGMRGKTLCLYLALLPKMFVDTKYRAKDVSATKKFEATPLMVKVKSDRGVKYAKELIDEMMKSFGLSANISFVPQITAKMYPFDTTDKLIERNLVKLVKTEVKPFPSDLK